LAYTDVSDLAQTKPPNAAINLLTKG